MSLHRSLLIFIVGLLTVAQVRPLIGRQASGAAGQASAQEESAARGWFNSGSTLLGTRNYLEAMKDFQVIVDKYKRSSLFDDALLALATYSLEIENDLVKAQQRANELVQLPGGLNRMPNGYLILGRVALARGRTPADFNSALVSYGRVLDRFPGHDEAVAEALYRIGDAHRLAARPDDAIDSFRRVCADYPKLPWCAQAALGMARSLVRTGRWQQAVERLQWVRANFPGTDESDHAYRWNTILFRLYVRPDPILTLSTAASVGIKDVEAMVVDPAGRLLLAGRGGVRIFVEGSERPGFCSLDCGVVFLGQLGKPFAIRAGWLTSEQGPLVALSMMKDGKPRPVGNTSAAAAFSTGEVLVAVDDVVGLQRFSASGQVLSPSFPPQVRAARLAMNELDEVAVLERDAKMISMWRREGTLIRSISIATLRNPVDIAFDPLGHLYVLDRDSGTVEIINPFERSVGKKRSFSIPERMEGAFQKARAFALDAFGRVLIFDQKTERVRTYQ